MNLQAPCPTCRGPGPLLFRTRDYNRRLSQESFDYFRCPQCGLIFLHPIPADLARYYPNDYYPIPASVNELAAVLPAAQYKIDIINRFAKPGRFLEIGPACGDLALLAKKAGFDVETIEMDARCCEFLIKQVGVRATCTSDILAALRQSQPYDVIALWHVIEHLPDPSQTISAIAGQLNPGGIAVIAAPNPDAFQFKLLGKRWAHVDAPRHLALIPQPLLARLAVDVGLEEVWSTTDDRGARGWNTFGWKQSLGNLATSGWRNSVVRRIARFISKLARPFDRKPGRGSAYTVVFRKGAA
jgi:2-polyprenyl-3-methyl-5-hydroxy-6-metoxy-1,4-benzoquinol methylase